MIGFAIWFLSASVLLHPAQETFTEMQWNGQTNRIEISMRLSVLDEQALIQPFGGSVNPTMEAIIRHLRFGSESDLRKPLMDAESIDAIRKRIRWIGRQDEGAHVWCYLEYEPENMSDGSKVAVKAATQTDSRPTHVRCTIFDIAGPTATQHDHEHAPAVHRFTVLAKPTGQTGDDPPSLPDARSFSTTRSNPTAKIPWNAF